MAIGDERERLRREALDVYGWSNAPGDRYGAHSHAYTKILYCLEGSIDFLVPSDGQRIHLEPGDRMELLGGTSTLRSSVLPG